MRKIRASEILWTPGLIQMIRDSLVGRTIVHSSILMMKLQPVSATSRDLGRPSVVDGDHWG
jgi:hypothetical protein